jgi:general secretion pathway protein G
MKILSQASCFSRGQGSGVKERRRVGFTLTEILLVLAILGVIAAMVVPQLLGRQKESLIRTTKISIKGFEDALKQYAIGHDGEYPTGTREEVIGMLVRPGNDRDGKPISAYLEKSPNDAWGQALFYEYPSSKIANGTKPAIWSAGPNKQSEDGSGDDVNNWTEGPK